MSEGCTHDCSNCSQNCSEREVDFRVPANSGSHIKKVIGIVSGKGGVGKSMVTSLLAAEANRSGLSVGILDADITGPSIPKSFGVDGVRPDATEEGMFPVESAEGIKLMSMNLLLDENTNPVVWRGPVIAGAVKQFWSDVCWGDLDVLLVDMPPGTGDVPLTVFQSLPVDGIIIVSTPQELVSMIVEKAVRMAEIMNVPVIGFVENMSYVKCPDCGKEVPVFGASHVDELAAKYGVKNTARLPIDPLLTEAVDQGRVDKLAETPLKEFAEKVLR